MSSLHIGNTEQGKSFQVPIDIVTQKLALLGRTGSGKSYAATKIAEEMLTLGAQIVVLDPVGVWYGLRVSADGKNKGFSIPVFGGLNGDIPLQPTAGALLADLIVDRGISAVLDVSQFESDSHKARFAGDFAARFFYRKKAAPSAVHLFLEECQEFVPQNLQRGEEQMLHAFTRLTKLGRNFGIGVSMISQRPQEVNKKALNMSECLFAFQMTGTAERKAVEAWVSDKGLKEDLSDILPFLSVGSAHVWSPQWLRFSGTVRIGKKSTADVSSTPAVGANSRVSRQLAPVDLAKLKEAMSATIEESKANDPRELKKRIVELERELAKKPVVDPLRLKKQIDATVDSARREIRNALANRDREWIGMIAMQLADTSKAIKDALGACQVALTKRPSEIKELIVGASITTATTQSASQSKPEPRNRVQHAPSTRSGQGGGNASVGSGSLRRILTALAQHQDGLSWRQIGAHAGLSSKGGAFANNMSKARQSGWTTGDRGCVQITDQGLEALGEYEILPTGRDLQDWWADKLGNPESGVVKIFRAICDAYPNAISRQEIGQVTGLSHVGGSFQNNLSTLRTLQLIEGSGELIASKSLFE